MLCLSCSVTHARPIAPTPDCRHSRHALITDEHYADRYEGQRPGPLQAHPRSAQTLSTVAA